MKTSDFDYPLDEDLIAQHPADKRENCRLMVMDKKSGRISHDYFYNLLNYLDKGDTLIMNDTKVIPARLYGHRPGKDESIEVLLLRNTDQDIWETLVKPGKKMKAGQEILFGDGELSGKVLDIIEEGQRRIHFQYDGIWEEVLDRLGNMPLPPYITEKLKDPSDYQTVYAQVRGSAAAPTAGLHFSKNLLEELKKAGINLGFLTLHVGLGTFRPVKEENIEDHEMHAEFYVMSDETARLINQTKKEGHRVIAVGTTVTRTLESIVKKNHQIAGDSGWTQIFIYPGYQYEALDGLITNFHLPQSTLIMMISAFAGKDHVLNAYQLAVKERYRFFSFGDAMLIMDRKDPALAKAVDPQNIGKEEGKKDQ